MDTKGNDEALLRDISNSIKDLVAADPPPGQPTRQCFVMKTGFTINPADYDPTQATTAGQKLAALFDEIPKISPSWESSGSLVSFLWHDVLLTTGRAPLNPPPVQLQAQYEEAIRNLYGSEDNYINLIKSPFYDSLDAARQDVQDEWFKLVGLKSKIKQMLGDASNEEVDQMYDKMSPEYIDALTEAQKQLMLRQQEIDRYTTVLFEYSTGSLETILANLKTKMETYKKGSAEEEYYEVTAEPSNWWSYFEKNYQPEDAWTTITVEQGHSTSTTQDTYSKLGGGVNVLLFSYGSSGSRQVSISAENEEDISISFKIKTVEIHRPWMETALFDYKSITLASVEAGQWSAGEMTPSNKGSFTLLPTSMVLARDITVTATDFSSSTKDILEEHGSSAGTILNLFSFGGSDSSHTNVATWDKNNMTFSVPGVQIIGYSCALIPFFPKQSQLK